MIYLPGSTLKRATPAQHFLKYFLWSKCNPMLFFATFVNFNVSSTKDNAHAKLSRYV